MALYLSRFGDDAAGAGVPETAPISPAPAPSTPTFWTPGLVLAALAIGAIILLKGSERRARRQARAGRRYPRYVRSVRR